jgi:large exoprotein involved in heme utilization and adhesion
VDVRAGSLALRNGAQISTGTEPGSTGPAGPLNVDVAGRLEMSGLRLDGIPSGLTATTRGAGPGGDITVRAGSLAMDGRGFVIASTEGDGRAGNIGIQANDILLTNGAAIRARSLGSGAAGSVRIGASDALRLFAGGEIDTQALSSDGGNIDIRVGNLVHLKASAITTAVGSGQGAGGNIFIDPIFVILEDGSRIVANAFGGPGGNIRIIATYFLNTLDSLVDASSALGAPGTVSIDSPNTNLSTQLKVLPAAFFDASALVREACSSRYATGAPRSSLVGVGRGGLAASPERFATSSYFDGAAAPNAVAPAGLRLTTVARVPLAACAG